MATTNMLFSPKATIARFRDAVRTFRGKHPKHSPLAQHFVSAQQLAAAAVSKAGGISTTADVKLETLAPEEHALLKSIVKTSRHSAGPIVQFGTLLGETTASICRWKSRSSKGDHHRPRRCKSVGLAGKYVPRTGRTSVEVSAREGPGRSRFDATSRFFQDLSAATALPGIHQLCSVDRRRAANHSLGKVGWRPNDCRTRLRLLPSCDYDAGRRVGWTRCNRGYCLAAEGRSSPTVALTRRIPK